MNEQDAVAYLTPHHLTSDTASVGLTAGKMREAMGTLHHVVATKTDRITELEALVRELAGKFESLKDMEHSPQYHHQGMGCGVEDRCLQTDGYGAAEYGWNNAVDRYADWVIDVAEDALSNPLVSELIGMKEGGE